MGSSTTATYCLYELAINQDVQNKLRQEIDEVLKKHGKVTYNAVNDMTYLHKVVSETLRKYPPLPMLNCIYTKALDLPTTNIHIPEGTSVTISVLGIQRDPAIYPDPDKFDPERFDADQIAARHPYAYLPFGEGPRVCIGTRFGYMQTKVGIFNILAKFKVTLHPQTPVPLIIDEAPVILSPKGGVHAQNKVMQRSIKDNAIVDLPNHSTNSIFINSRSLE
ncbi:probable cytochrome P450 6a13 [Pseudomyrmex gracilis]|uniref:probable cytochrome P450 6a13 n=1 Tax=Pseudomyrmex gracilis TaxID=219809 RepID=UPI0009952D6C|nr:probable cytochrome P450 6a13 [Pseudomyrmex gracilis]